MADTQGKSLQRQGRRQQRQEQQMQVGPSSWRCRALTDHVFQGTPRLRGRSGAPARSAGQQTDSQSVVALPQGTCQRWAPRSSAGGMSLVVLAADLGSEEALMSPWLGGRHLYVVMPCQQY